MAAPDTRPSRPPVRWATHLWHILFVTAVTVGGLLFGISYTLWPLSPLERWFGVAMLVLVGFVWFRVVTYLTRPVEMPRPLRVSRPRR